MKKDSLLSDLSLVEYGSNVKISFFKDYFQENFIKEDILIFQYFKGSFNDIIEGRTIFGVVLDIEGYDDYSLTVLKIDPNENLDPSFSSLVHFIYS